MEISYTEVWGVQELSTSWEIKATPTFVFLKDGRQLDKLVGANKSDLQQKLAAMEDVTKSQSWYFFLMSYIES